MKKYFVPYVTVPTLKPGEAEFAGPQPLHVYALGVFKLPKYGSAYFGDAQAGYIVSTTPPSGASRPLQPLLPACCVRFVPSTREVYYQPSADSAILGSALASAADYFSTPYAIYYVPTDPLGFGAWKAVEVEVFNHRPQLTSAIPSVELHAAEPLNLRLPRSLFHDADGDQLTVTHQVAASTPCDASWIYFNQRTLQFYGQMPTAAFRDQSRLVS